MEMAGNGVQMGMAIRGLRPNLPQALVPIRDKSGRDNSSSHSHKVIHRRLIDRRLDRTRHLIYSLLVSIILRQEGITVIDPEKGSWMAQEVDFLGRLGERSVRWRLER